MMKGIKSIIRYDLPETNSSSSHSFIVSREGLIKRGDPEFDDLPIENNILVLNESYSFGWDWEKTNSCRIKLLYVCGLLCTKGDKHSRRLKEILKKYLEVDDVVFGWERETGIPGGPYDNKRLYVPDIDHQSYSNAMNEICENNETIINFIFSRNSWFYGGNDNSDCPEDDFYEELYAPEKTDPDAIIRISYGGSIGDMDIELKHYPQTRDIIFDRIIYSDVADVISCWNKDCGFFNSEQKPEQYVSIDSMISYRGQLYLLYLSDGFLKRLASIDNELLYRRNREKRAEAVRNLIDTDKSIKDGVDYKLFPLKIISDELGIL